MEKEEIDMINKECQGIENVAVLYGILGKNDRHLINLYHWTKDIKEIQDDIACADIGLDLDDQFQDIVDVLTMEIGVRVYGCLKVK